MNNLRCFSQISWVLLKIYFFSQCMHMHGVFITSSWFRVFAKYLSCIPTRSQTPLIEGLGANLPPFNCELCSGIFLWNFILSNLNYLIYLKEEIKTISRRAEFNNFCWRSRWNFLRADPWIRPRNSCDVWCDQFLVFHTTGFRIHFTIQ